MKETTSETASFGETVELYRSILEALPLATFLCDKNKTILAVFHLDILSISKEYHIESYVGRNLADYLPDIPSPLSRIFHRYSEVFNRVMLTGNKEGFKSELDGEYFETEIHLLGEDYVLVHVHNISMATKKKSNEERAIRNELSMAMTAGGITSWNYDVKARIISSRHDNEVFKEKMAYEDLLLLIRKEDRHLVSELFEKIIAGNVESAEMTLQVRNLHGEMVWVNIHAIPQKYDDEGKVSIIVGSQKNITKERFYETARNELIKQNELILDNINCGLIYITSDYHVAWENTSKALPPELKDRSYFFEVGELCYKNEARMPGSDTRKLVQAAFHEKTVQRKIKFLQSGIWVEMTFIPVLAADGVAEGVVLKIEDVTERISMRKEYEVLSNRMTTIVDSLPMGIDVYTTEGVLTFANEASFKLFGVTREEVDISRITIGDNPHIPNSVKADVKAGKEVYFSVSYDFRKGNEYFASSLHDVLQLDYHGVPVFNQSGELENYVFMVSDVTLEKRINNELRRSRRKIELAMQAANIMFWEFDVQRQVFHSENEALNDYNSYRALSAADYAACRHPDEQEKVGKIVERMCVGEDFPISFDSRVKLPGCTDWLYCKIDGVPFEKDENGRVTRYIGSRRDTTEIQKKRLLQENILNSIPVSIHIKDVNNNFCYVFCNDESRHLFGTAENKVALDLMDTAAVARLQKTDMEVFLTGNPYLGMERIELRDGRTYDMLVRKSVIYDDDKRLLLNVRWDQSLQKELERRSELFDVTLVNMKAYTWMYESEKKEFCFGEGAERVVNIPLADLSSKQMIEYVHPDDRKMVLEKAMQALGEENDKFNIEYRADYNVDGVYEWWQTYAIVETVVIDELPHKYAYGMTLNIDDRKQTELTLLKNKEELNRLVQLNGLVLNNANAGLVYIGMNYEVQWENLAVCSSSLSCVAYKKGEICYKSAFGRTSPCKDCVIERVLRSRQTEQMIRSFDNGNVVEIFATPVFKENGEVDGAVIRLDDVTKRERMIHELERAKTLAEQSDKLKSAFLANMSHEIRTPLNAIVGFSGLLADTGTPEEKEEFIKIINLNSDLLLKLINDILDLSKIEAGTVELKYEDYDLASQLEDLSLSLGQRVKGDGVQLVNKRPYPYCKVRLDRNRVTQIMTNYVTNAIKYTPKGVIEMGYEVLDGAIRLYVKDSGIGIQEDKKSKVFHRFEKLDEFAQGTGLGLSICKATAESMGGKVGFESRYGEGSCFWAVLPCDVEVKSAYGSGAKVLRQELEADRLPMAWEDMLASSVRKRILVVEDMPSNYLLVSVLLRKYFNLVNARNGQEAVKAVQNGNFDLVLMDMKMPVMDGLTATAEIRKFNADIPIVALTAHAFDADYQAAMKAGCNDYLVKPVDRNKMVAVLKKYCCRRGKE